MDNRSDIRDFLTSRRARITPEQAGLLPGGGRRRVPGLRREEVAVLAGVSTDWYTRLEKGHISGVSEDVLEAVARALQLDEAERTYLFDLARAARPTRAPQRRSRVDDPAAGPVDARLDDGLRRLHRQPPAGHRRDQRPGVGPARTAVRQPRGTANFARFQFLDPRARDYYPNWDGAANVTVALLRAEAGRRPNDTQLRELVGELSTVSEEFRIRWAAHNVRIHHNGVKQFHHPVVGGLDLAYNTLDLPTGDSSDLRLTIYTAEPGTPSEDALKLLASWAATRATEAPSAAVTERP